MTGLIFLLAFFAFAIVWVGNAIEGERAPRFAKIGTYVSGGIAMALFIAATWTGE